MIFGGGIFGRWLSHEGRTLMNEISATIKETPQSSLSPSTLWGYREKMAIYQSESRPLLDTESLRALILDFLASWTVINNFFWFINHAVYDIML